MKIGRLSFLILCYVILLNVFINISYSSTIPYVFNNKANPPKVVKGMTPLIFDENDFREATMEEIMNNSWYLYNGDIGEETEIGEVIVDRIASEKWANVKLADDSMFVWIPRYSYKIIGDDTPGDYSDDKIFIKYSNGVVDYKGDGYIAHPGFWWDNNNNGVREENEELTGIWVAKFEASNDGAGRVQIKPAVKSWRDITVGETFDECRQMQTENSEKYGINANSNVIDIHLMKNTEWGVVAYLTEAIRDGDETESNGNYAYYTGDSNSATTVYTNNVEQTSTGNAYGIYDLNGGAWEYVACYIANNDDNINNFGSSLKNAASKYKDELTGVFTPSTRQQSYITTSGGTVGMALHEVSTAETGNNPFCGYSDTQTYVGGTSPFLLRGGAYDEIGSGIFAFDSNTGEGAEYRSFRPVLVPVDNTPPTIQFSKAMQTTGTDDVTTSITISDNVEVSHFYYQWSNNSTRPSTDWIRVEGEITNMPLTHENTGVLYLHVEAYDIAGNVKYNYRGPFIKVESGIHIPIDETKPTITVTPESRDGDITDISVIVNVSDNIGIRNWNYKWSTTNDIPTTNLICGVSLNQTLEQKNTGIWYLYVVAEDLNGNKNGTEGSGEIFGPYIKTQTDMMGPNIIADKTKRNLNMEDITVTLTVTDESGVSDWNYAWKQSTMKPLDTDPEWEEGPENGIVAQNMDGIWYLHVKAVDTVGNTTYKYFGAYKKGIQKENFGYAVDTVPADRKNFKYFIGKNRDGEIIILLVNPTAKATSFGRGDVLNLVDNTFKDNIYYIDNDGIIKKY